MLKVYGISLGSSERDFFHTIELLGKVIQVSRIGSDGSYDKAKNIIREKDGLVDVFSLGGVNLNFVLGEKRYPISVGQEIAKTAVKTPVIDGERVKAVLEVETLKYLQREKAIDFKGKRILFVSALDRYPMAYALEHMGAKLIIGDALFALGLPIPFRSLKVFTLVGRLTLPLLKHIPFAYLYPTGAKQEVTKPKFVKYFHEADIIAGDYHFIGRYMPQDLKGKTVITSTITKKNLQSLKERGVRLLVTTSPQFEGRSFGGNILEGLFLVLNNCQGKGKSNNTLYPEEIIKLADKIGWKPRLEFLN